MHSSSQGNSELHLAIAATFTAEPVEKPVSFLLEQLNLSHSISFAPYNQVFQQLLDPNSLFGLNKASTNKDALNVIFLRLQDWLSESNTSSNKATPSPSNGSQTNGQENSHSKRALKNNVDEFLRALQQASSKGNASYLVVFCPSSESNNSAPVKQEIVKQAENYIINKTRDAGNISIISQLQVFDAYPVDDFDDPHAARAGHVPYTADFYAALAAVTIRRFTALSRTPHKVIVLDCDNTLWHGVCGEEGPKGVRITDGYKSLQAFMLAQKEAGMLLCLASKNVEKDVQDVFEQNEGMLLRRNDIVAGRINWQPKSANIQSLAEELNLGLDSFIFIDDNPIECAEVRANCPDLTVLQLPNESEEIEHFLSHVWVFDKIKVTDEDKKRAERYQQNAKREQAKIAATSLKSFLEGLELSIDIAAPAAVHYPRIAQLTQRTNQFNTTTIRRTESDITSLLQAKRLNAAAVHVSDRFGDYGLVGAMLYGYTQKSLQVDSFILSCRALGRGVEQAMARFLAQEAEKKQIETIQIAFSKSARNEPVHAFLNTVAPFSKSEFSKGVVYTYNADDLLKLVPLEAATPSIAITNKSTSDTKLASLIQRPVHQWQYIATTLNSASAITHQVLQRTTPRPSLQTPFVEPQTQEEQAVAQIWQDILGVDQIGMDDGFKELGGTSLQIVQIYGRLMTHFDIELPFTTLFGLPTIRAFIDYLAGQSHKESDRENQAKAIQQRAARQKAAMQQRKKLQLNLR